MGEVERADGPVRGEPAAPGNAAALLLLCAQLGSYLAFHDIASGVLPSGTAFAFVSYRALGCQLFTLGSCVGFAVAFLAFRLRFGPALRYVGISLQVAAFCAVFLSAGKEVGSLATLSVHGFVLFDSVSFSVVSAMAFLLLTLATLEFGVDKGLKTLWGLCEKTAPKAHYEESFERRCDELAGACGLTARERQIMGLLAKGRRPNEIKDELVITIATTRTHIQRIYRKLMVHSERELVDLVQNGRSGRPR